MCGVEGVTSRWEGDTCTGAVLGFERLETGKPKPRQK